MCAAIAQTYVGEPAPLFQVHLEPAEPNEVGEFTGAMASLARQYGLFVERHGAFGRARDARLLVWNVSPGSIDIGLLPDWGSAAGILASAFDQLKLTLEFAEAIHNILEFFKSPKKKEDSPGKTILDCDDAINIVSPIANHGGTQTFNVYKNVIQGPVLVMNAAEANGILENATALRKELAAPEAGARSNVALVWTQLNRNDTRTAGQRSPDKAVIEEISQHEKPVFFNDDVLYLKEGMIGDEGSNPYRFVYFVDVQIMMVQGKVVGYRIRAYHHKDLLPEK